MIRCSSYRVISCYRYGLLYQNVKSLIQGKLYICTLQSNSLFQLCTQIIAHTQTIQVLEISCLRQKEVQMSVIRIIRALLISIISKGVRSTRLLNITYLETVQCLTLLDTKTMFHTKLIFNYLTFIKTKKCSVSKHAFIIGRIILSVPYI